MTAKERVQNALARRPVDRVPIFLWFHPETAARLGTELGIPAARVGEAFGNDVAQAWVGNNAAMEGVVHERDGDGHTDAWGIEWAKEGPFNQIRRSPLRGAAAEAVARYGFPRERIPELLENMLPVAARRAEAFIGCDVSPCLFEMLCRLRGMDEAALDLAAEPAQAADLLERACVFSVELATAACDRFRPDWLWTGDDVGGQHGMIISPAAWRRFIAPRLARIVDIGRRRGLWVAFHSCGAIRPIIPDLIAAGVQVLNPVQCNCPGMDPLELKREFGRDLAFMGGVDTQELLPRGSADDVYGATRRLVEGMTADGGGYILAASHTVPPETPLANIFALFAAAGVGRDEILARAEALRAERATAP